MVSDQQVRRLFMLIQQNETLSMAAAKAGLDVKTARKYRRLRRLPSELHKPRTWRTRKDAFAEAWDELSERLNVNPGLEAKTLFEALQRKYPGRFADRQAHWWVSFARFSGRCGDGERRRDRPRKCSSPRCMNRDGWRSRISPTCRRST